VRRLRPIARAEQARDEASVRAGAAVVFLDVLDGNNYNGRFTPGWHPATSASRSAS